MLIEQLSRQVVIAELPIDKRLLDRDVRIRLMMAGLPPMTCGRIAKAADVDIETARRSLKRLKECGWVAEIEGPRKRQPLSYACLPSYAEEIVAARLVAVKERVDWLGQWLMRNWLDVIVEETECIDNSRPSWLKSPGMGYMELDRDYPGYRVGFEFQGQQHYQEGGPFSTNRDKLDEQIRRDNIKAGVCARNSYTLIEVCKTDLSLKTMTDKIKGHLPTAIFNPEGPIVRTLVDLSKGYSGA
ncbi:MAG: hypothetical protein GX600_06630 [Dehalococcoidia bacterium]|nr:hypothetical protein [Dehalococcoidia bacterium]OPZ62686.1 MAG: hypothetical protein BWY85_02005 [Firmicutes bacterium ADurb.Bin506]